MAAGYQESIVLSLAERAIRVAEEIGGCPILVVGGVARNRRLRELMAARAERVGISVHVPAPELCTDNAAMIAAAGLHKLTLAGADGPETDTSASLPLESWPSPRGR